MTEQHIPMSPIKAIRLNCLECSNFSSVEVKTCAVQKCPLYPFRSGKNPYRQKRVMTEEQRQAAKDRLAKYREAKVTDEACKL